MDNSFFDMRVQSIMQDLMMQLLERLMTKLENSQKSTGSTTELDGDYDSASLVYGDFSSLINQAAEKYNVNPELVDAVVHAESNYNPSAVSSAGALGLMQLMPATASWLGVSDPLDPVQNIDGGVRFLSQLLDRYNGNTSLAVAAYNAGPGAVDKYGGIPPYQETQTYVTRVLGYFNAGNQWEA
jgi:soluble lytic murein transglycosylase-like protein